MTEIYNLTVNLRCQWEHRTHWKETKEEMIQYFLYHGWFKVWFFYRCPSKPWQSWRYSLPTELPTATTSKTLTSVSSSWGSLSHRSLRCICNGRRSQHRAQRPDSLLLAAWHLICLEPWDTLSCSRPPGKTRDRPPNTPTCRCHLREGRGGEGRISKYSRTEGGESEWKLQHQKPWVYWSEQQLI